MKFILRLIFTLLLLGVIIWQLGGLRELGELLAELDPVYVILVLAVCTFDRALMTFKWIWLLRGRGMYLPFFRGMKIYCASMVWGMFLPSTMGADAIRAFSTSRTGFDSKEVVASIIVERMVGFLSALLLGLISLVLLSLSGNLDSRFEAVWWFGSVMLVGATIAFAASFSQRTFDVLYGWLPHRVRDTRIMQRLQKFHSTYQAYRDNKITLVTFFGMTFGEQLMPILQTWLSAQALGIDVGLFFVAGVVPLALLISRIPISIDGWGVFDGVFILLMSLAGVSPSEAVAITLVSRILQTISWLPWWMAQVMESGRFRPPQPVVQEG